MSGPRFNGDVAIVTGGAEGIGAAIARRLAADGASVLIADVQDAKGEALAAEIGGAYARCDVGEESDWARTFAKARDLGPIRILVNNAGINPGVMPFESLSLNDWRRVMRVNLDGVFLGCREATRAMRDEGGCIVNIASAQSLKPNPDYPAYAASKAGVASLTRTLALYFGAQGLPIRCNAVLPGSVDTPLTDRLRADTGDETAARARSAARHPIGFVGVPDDIAAATSFLASNEARFITGALMPVDGGLSI